MLYNNTVDKLTEGGGRMKTIYIDVLIVLNIYVNFFLLKATAKFTHTALKTVRCTFSAVVGSLFSLTILLPHMGFLLSLFLKFIASAVITFTAFGKNNFLRMLFYFYIINFIFAGVVLLLYNIFQPSFMAFDNSYMYIDFSLLSLVVFTAIAYFSVRVFRYFSDKKADLSQKYTVEIKYKGSTLTVEGLADTGNLLTDSFTGKPVIICPKSLFGYSEDELCDPIEAFEKHGLRSIPCSTVSGSGMIPLIVPESIAIVSENGVKKNTDALIGLSDKTDNGIFSPVLIK